MKYYIVLLISFFCIFPVYADMDYVYPRVGIVKGEYEQIENVLKEYRIDFKFIKYKNLENAETYKYFDVIFLPCGIGPSIQTNINILSRGKNLAGLSLKDEYYKIDEDKAGKNIRNFISLGGIVYFSDFSCKFLQKSLECVKFYKNFPYLGLEGYLKFDIGSELPAYSINSISPVYFSHAGWIFPAKIENSKVLMHTKAETPWGIKKTILGAIVPFNDGEAVYSGLHLENMENDLKRYFAFRTVYGNYLIKIKKYLKDQDQAVLSFIVDKSLPEEICRTYNLDIDKKSNYLYFFPDRGEWQIDIFDNKGRLILSKQGIRNQFYYKFSVLDNQKITIRIYSLSEKRYALYAFLSVQGDKKSKTPSFYYYIIAAIFLFVFVLLIVLRRPRISGKGRI